MHQLIAIFLKEHIEINILIKEINKEKDAYRRSRMIGDVQELLLKHFAIEELLNDKYSGKTKNIKLAIERIKDEHLLMLKLFKDKLDTKWLAQFLLSHEEFEEKTLYPALEENVTDKDMREIMTQLLTMKES